MRVPDLCMNDAAIKLRVSIEQLDKNMTRQPSSRTLSNTLSTLSLKLMTAETLGHFEFKTEISL
jgi:hypothetical protein